MNNDRLGPQVLAAMKFLQQIYHDLAVLIQHADKVFDEHKWSATDKTKTFSRLGNRLNPKVWLLTRLYRFYTAKTPQNFDGRIIALIPVLHPSKGYDEPVCTAWAVTVSRPAKSGIAVKSRKGFRDLVNWLEGQIGEVELAADVIQARFPQATRVRAVVVPLCDLAGQRELIDRLIRPILNASLSG